MGEIVKHADDERHKGGDQVVTTLSRFFSLPLCISLCLCVCVLVCLSVRLRVWLIDDMILMLASSWFGDGAPAAQSTSYMRLAWLIRQRETYSHGTNPLSWT